MCVSVGGGNGIWGGQLGRVMVRSKGCKEGCSLRTFSPPTLPEQGVGSGEAGEHQEGMGVKAPLVSATIRLCSAPRSCNWSQEGGPCDQESWASKCEAGFNPKP